MLAEKEIIHANYYDLAGKTAHNPNEFYKNISLEDFNNWLTEEVKVGSKIYRTFFAFNDDAFYRVLKNLNDFLLTPEGSEYRTNILNFSLNPFIQVTSLAVRDSAWYRGQLTVEMDKRELRKLGMEFRPVIYSKVDKETFTVKPEKLSFEMEIHNFGVVSELTTAWTWGESVDKIIVNISAVKEFLSSRGIQRLIPNLPFYASIAPLYMEELPLVKEPKKTDVDELTNVLKSLTRK